MSIHAMESSEVFHVEHPDPDPLPEPKQYKPNARGQVGPQLGKGLHLLLTARQQGWRVDALCASSELWPGDQVLERVERFYPGREDPAGKIADAKAVCAQCPVREQCLDFALSMGEKIGVWGMTTGAERRVLRRRWVKEQKAKLAALGERVPVQLDGVGVA